MINLHELKLIDILPTSLQGDKDILALTKAFDSELQAITQTINEIVLLPRIEELQEEILDSLAWQYHVDFYEPLGLGIEKKRALVKNALNWHRHKGTRGALEDAIRILFFDAFTIGEWFEYDGDPFTFRVTVWETMSQDEFNRFLSLIHEMKNVRSHLEKIISQYYQTSTFYIGTAFEKLYQTTELEPGIERFHALEKGFYIGTGFQQQYVVTESAKPEIKRTQALEKGFYAGTGFHQQYVATEINAETNSRKSNLLTHTYVGTKLERIYTRTEIQSTSKRVINLKNAIYIGMSPQLYSFTQEPKR